MSGREQDRQKRLAMQIAAGILLAALFVGLGVWGISDSGDQPYNWLFVAGLVIFSLLYISAVMLMIQQNVGYENTVEPTTEKCWVDRTINLNDLPPATGVNVEHEITFIHSDYIVM